MGSGRAAFNLQTAHTAAGQKRAGKTLKSAGKVAKGARPVFLASPAGLVLTNPKVSGFQLVINPKTFGLDGIDLGLQYTFSESDFI